MLEEFSILGLFLSSAQIRTLLKKYPPEEFAQKSIVFVEGNTPTHLIVLLSGKLRLSSGLGAYAHSIGILEPCRAANLYSVVRGLPLQYSGQALGKVLALKIPWFYLQEKIAKDDSLLEYLKLVTEYSAIRKLAKELSEFECKKAFVIRLIGCLQVEESNPHTIILQEGQIPDKVFMVLQGSVLASKNSATQNNNQSAPFWNIPERSWQNFAAVINQKQSDVSYRTLSSVKIVTCTYSQIASLKKDYPKDFVIFSRWMTTFTLPKDLNPEEAVEPDVESIIAFFKKKPIHQKRFRLQYPFVAQHEEMDCGPACLAMISSYFGNDLSIQYWRDRLNMSREGTTLLDLGAAAEKSGFVSHGLGIQSFDQMEAGFFPLIALRQYHYMVVYEANHQQVIVGDPAAGIRKLTPKEFLSGFENAILVLRPTQEFFKIVSPDKPYAHYFHWMGTFGKEIAFVFSASLLLVFFSLISPLIVQTVLDDVLGQQDKQLLLAIIGGGCIVAIIQGILYWLRSYFLNYISSHYTFHATSAFLRKLFSLPYSFFHTRHVGDFIHRLNELDHVREFCSSTLIGLLLDLLSLVIFLVIIFFYSPRVGIATLILAPILIGIAMIFSRRMNLTYSEVFNGYAQQEGLITDLVQGVATIKTLDAEVSARWRFEEQLVKTLRSRQGFLNLSSSLVAISQTYEQILYLFLLGSAASLEMNGGLSAGQIVALSMFVAHTIKPFEGVAQAWSSIQQIQSTLARLNEVLLASPETSARPKALRKTRLLGDIEFIDVYFRMGGESSNWILKGVSFKIEAGQNVAIVGPSGSGKSTLANLIVRLFEVTQGQILIDGRDIRDYDLRWLRTQIGFLHQASHLFHGTIADNIGFKSPILDDHRLEKSAQLAKAHAFIEKKPFGYATLLNHGGLGLSGGEKQRIALARMLYGEPSLFCLDEATAALDNFTERDFLKDFKAAAAGKTILNIAHRPSTVMMSEFALLLKDGHVAGFGTHEQLNSKNGLYQALFHPEKNGRGNGS